MNLKVIITIIFAALVVSAHAPKPIKIPVKMEKKIDFEVLNAEHRDRQLQNEKACNLQRIYELSQKLAQK